MCVGKFSCLCHTGHTNVIFWSQNVNICGIKCHRGLKNKNCMGLENEKHGGSRSVKEKLSDKINEISCRMGLENGLKYIGKFKNVLPHFLIE